MNPIERRVEKERRLSVEYLRSILRFEPETGYLFWKIDRNYNALAGSLAGHPTKLGYWSIKIDGIRYQAHRLIWAMETGEWPAFDVDHEDTDGLNNRWNNLREASRGQNCANRSARNGTASGIKGVWWHKANQKWVACFQKSYLGSFENIDDARAAYARAAVEGYQQFARVSSYQTEGIGKNG